MSASAEIIELIDDRLREARNEIASLQAARTAMAERPAPNSNGTSAPSAARPARRRAPRGASTGTTRRSRSAVVVPAGKLEALLAHGDLPTVTLAEQTGGDRAQVLTLLREMEDAGTIQRVGARRGTRWHLVTDEERIAARVAELERASSRRR